MSRKEFEKFQGEVHTGPDHSAPYPVSRMAPSIELVDLAREIQTADTLINTKAGAKLQVIVDQIKVLQQQARTVLEHARRDKLLHQAQCNFQRKPGNVYHLYSKAEGISYFSMLSPQEWGAGHPHQHLGSYRLENDYSWTPLEEITVGDDPADETLRRLLDDIG